MDHKQLLASLSPDERRALTHLSDRRGALAVASHFCALLVSGTAIWSGFPGWWLVLVPHGILLIFLFTLLHETSHATVFRTKTANRFVGAVCGFLVLVPSIWFRYFHLAHHRHTHDPQRDPELETQKPQTAMGYVWHVSGLPTWFGQLATLSGNALGRTDYDYLPKSAAPRVVLEARLSLAFYGALIGISAFAGWSALVWLWLIPALLGQPFLRLYLLAEHARCPHVANMLANTRTTFTNRIVRWLAWNMPYHAEHHAYPAVPFHMLPEFHRRSRQYLKETEHGYRRFNQRYFAAISDGTAHVSTK